MVVLGGLDDDRHGKQQHTRRGGDQIDAGVVIAVRAVERGDDRPGVKDGPLRAHAAASGAAGSP
jgi:hypothetical protein